MVDAVISVQEEQRQRRLHFLVKTLRSQGAQDVTLSASQTSGMGAPMVAVSDELCFLTMTQAATLFASKTLTPTMLLHAIFDHIDRTEPTLNSFVCEMRSTAEVQAAVSTERWAAGSQLGPLDGNANWPPDCGVAMGGPRRATNCSRISASYGLPYQARCALSLARLDLYCVCLHVVYLDTFLS
eukprot:COSAG02_NODE_934_length_15809_cov_59.853787_7_plen_184_part_00